LEEIMSDPFCVLSARVSNAFGCVGDLEEFQGSFEAEAPFTQEEIGSPTAITNPDYPTTLPDLVKDSIGETLVVSPKLAAFLRAEVADLELLPLKILDPERKLVSDAYQLVHLLNPPDCIDMERADPKWSWDKKLIKGMNDRKCPLVSDRIPSDRRLFYPKKFPRLQLIRRDFGEAIVAAGFTNVRLKSIEDALAYF